MVFVCNYDYDYQYLGTNTHYNFIKVSELSTTKYTVLHVSVQWFVYVCGVWPWQNNPKENIHTIFTIGIIETCHTDTSVVSDKILTRSVVLTRF